MSNAKLFSRALRSLILGAFFVSCAQVCLADGARAVWRPYGARESRRQCDFVDALLRCGLHERATIELTALEESLRERESYDRAQLMRFGACAARCALETSNLLNASQRDASAARLDGIRDFCETREKNDDYSQLVKIDPNDRDALDYALAITRAYYILGDVEYRAKDARSEIAAERLRQAFEIAKRLVPILPKDQARPFLYWSAQATLDDLSNTKRFETAERLATALENASRDALDEFYFVARILLIESARLQNLDQEASRRLDDTLRSLDAARNRQDRVARIEEFAVALLAEEAVLLDEEGNAVDALKQALSDVDLLGASLPERTRRFADYLYDSFELLYFTRVRLIWQVLDDPELEKNLKRNGLEISQDQLLQNAQNATRALCDNYWKTRAALLTVDAADSLQNRDALQAAAENALQNGALREALDLYDRAAEDARQKNASEDERRLRAVAAGVADKICREQLERRDLFSEEEARAFRDQTSRRFEQIARDYPNAENARLFFLMAISLEEENTETNYQKRLDYLEVFPDAPDRDAVALDLAKRANNDDALDVVATALDLVGDRRTQPELQTNLELALAAKKYAQAQPSDQVRIAQETFVRILRKTAWLRDVNREPPFATAIESLSARPESLEDADVVYLGALVELALNRQELHTREVLKALQDALRDVYNSRHEDQRARVASLLLAVSLALESGDDVVSALAMVEDSAATSLDSLDALLEFAQRAPENSRRASAQFVLDALKSQESSARVELLRADALRLLGRAQEALNLYAKYRKNQDAILRLRALKGLATILSEQRQVKELELALNYWEQVADLLPNDSPQWWDAQEATLRLYLKLERRDAARKFARAVWLTHEDQKDPERRARWERLVEGSD